MGEFPAGTIVAAGMAASDDRNKIVLAAYTSADGGKTWQFLSNIAEGQNAPYDPGQRAFITKLTPVWEPYHVRRRRRQACRVLFR